MENTQSGSSIGLVLVGGGARAAYQAGVLRGIGEIISQRRNSRPLFDIVTGISAGAINAAMLASRADKMTEATLRLDDLWKNIQMQQVMRTDVSSIFSIGSRWMKDLSLGGVLPGSGSRSNYLLDTTPLREFLGQRLDIQEIGRFVANRVLQGFAVSATNYVSGTAVTFFSKDHESLSWVRSARLGWPTQIRLEHILASASLPILFKPVELEGSFYGDGGIRMNTPLSPAIHLGADRVLAISIRHSRSEAATQSLNQQTSEEGNINR